MILKNCARIHPALRFLLLISVVLFHPACSSFSHVLTESPPAHESVSSNDAAVAAADIPATEGDDTGSDDEDNGDEGDAAQQENGTPGLTEAEQAVQNVLDTALELAEQAQELWTNGDSDKALDNLDNAYLLIAKVPQDSGPRFIQQKDDLRFMISKRITEIYASRITTTNGTHQEIPLVLNDHVQREIELFQGMERDFFLESYQRSGYYRQEIVKALKAAGLPEEISWLPLIESGFKPKALSRSRALGLWQFIPSTGYKYGLKRNDWIDERLHPEKATQAAIAYLTELHQIFGDWATALAAYNCGEGNVLRAIREQKVNYLDNFWDLYERLPRETARYYPRFLAVLAIVRDPAKYGFTLPDPSALPPCETVDIEKQVQLSKVAEKLDCSVEDITRLNPELRREATPPTPYTLTVPSGKAAVLTANIDSIPKYTPPKPAYVVHRVRRGETLSLIANRYRTSIQRIMDANRLRSARYLRVGQKLKIPLRNT